MREHGVEIGQDEAVVSWAHGWEVIDDRADDCWNCASAHVHQDAVSDLDSGAFLEPCAHDHGQLAAGWTEVDSPESALPFLAKAEHGGSVACVSIAAERVQAVEGKPRCYDGRPAKQALEVFQDNRTALIGSFYMNIVDEDDAGGKRSVAGLVELDRNDAYRVSDPGRERSAQELPGRRWLLLGYDSRSIARTTALLLGRLPELAEHQRS